MPRFLENLCRVLVPFSAVGLLVTAASAAELDLSNPEDALKANQKIQCSLTDGKPTVFTWWGKAYSRIEGERDRHLFNVEGFNVRHCKSFQDEERGYGYRMVSREILLYLDPETDEILRTWTNPITGEEVDVIHVANDPVNMRAPNYSISKDGKPYEFRANFKDGKVWTGGEAPLFYVNPLAGDYQKNVGGMYHAMEMINFFMSEDELLDADNDEAMDVFISWGRISKFLPWMEMGGRQGLMVFHTAGKKVAGWDDLSDRMKGEVNANYPDYVAPPPLDDDRPNETSWTYFKKVLDARAAE